MTWLHKENGHMHGLLPRSMGTAEVIYGLKHCLTVAHSSGQICTATMATAYQQSTVGPAVEMSQAGAETLLKTVIGHIVHECRLRGHAVSETLAAFMVGKTK